MVRLDVGRRAKTETGPCNVEDCKNPALRSVSGEVAEKYLSGIEFPADSGRKRPHVHLCRDHYKEFKKASKEDRKLDTLGYSPGSAAFRGSKERMPPSG